MARCEVFRDLPVNRRQLPFGCTRKEPCAEDLPAPAIGVGGDLCDGWEFLVRLREFRKCVPGVASQQLDRAESPRRLQQGVCVRR